MEETPLVQHGWAFVAVRGDHNTVNVSFLIEVLGLLMVTLLAVLVWIGWRRSESRYYQTVEYVIDER